MSLRVAQVAQSVRHLTLDLRSGLDLRVLEFKACAGPQAEREAYLKTNKQCHSVGNDLFMGLMKGLVGGGLTFSEHPLFGTVHG